MHKYAKKKMWSAVRHVLCGVGLCAGVLFVAAPFSCKMTDEGIAMVATDKNAPQILSYKCTAADVLTVTCDKPMTLTDIAFTSAEDGEPFVQDIAIAYDESGQSAELTLDRPMVPGKNYELTGIVTDTNGNTLEFSLPVTGYNGNLARVMLSEVRYGNSDRTKKAEFAELYVLAGGNLAGLELYGGYYGNKLKYEFPAIEVSTGEYITVHLRNYDGNTDETGTALDLPFDTPDASETARDLWVSDSKSGYFTKNDVVVIVDAVSGDLQDAILMTEAADKLTWTNARQTTLAEQAVAAGVWKGGSDRSYAALSKGIGVINSLSRQNIAEVIAAYSVHGAQAVTASKADWALVAATPGKENTRP